MSQANGSAVTEANTETNNASQIEAHENPLISNARLKEVFATMVKCRMLEESTRSAFSGSGRLSAIGHEATLVSAAMQLGPRDSIASTLIEIAYRLAQNVPTQEILSAIREASGGGAFASDLQRAIDAAKRYKRKKPSHISLAYANNRDSETEVWHDALRTAHKHSLPMVFVSQNDLYDNAAKSSSPQYGLPVLMVDGTDAIACYRCAQEATHRARNAGGPTLTECKTYRSNRQAGAADNPVPDPVLDARDPIAKVRHQLEAKGLYKSAWAVEIETSFRSELDDALASTASHIGPASEHPSPTAVRAGQK